MDLWAQKMKHLLQCRIVGGELLREFDENYLPVCFIFDQITESLLATTRVEISIFIEVSHERRSR